MKTPLTVAVVALTYLSAAAAWAQQSDNSNFDDRFQSVHLPTWNVTENVSAITDKRTVNAVLPAQGDAGKNVAFGLICDEQGRIATVLVGLYQHFGSTGEKVKVLIRLGDAPAKEAAWMVLTNRGIGSLDPVTLLKSLPHGGRLVIRAVLKQGRPVEGVFILDELDRVRDKVLRACPK